MITMDITGLTSGFAAAFFEKMLKQTKPTLWLRNIQLASFGIVVHTYPNHPNHTSSPDIPRDIRATSRVAYVYIIPSLSPSLIFSLKYIQHTQPNIFTLCIHRFVHSLVSTILRPLVKRDSFLGLKKP